jgi:hypothetical protein
MMKAGGVMKPESSKKSDKLTSRVPRPLVLLLAGSGLWGCGGTVEESSTESVQQPLTSAEDEAVAKTLAPLRSLDVPGGVYMTSVEQTSSATGNFTHVVHVYQPDSNGEGIRFELGARTSGGAVDTSHTFQSVTLTSHPGEADQSSQTLPNGSGTRVYSLSTSRRGWYRLVFVHGAPSGGRTLSIKAYDAANNALKMGWSDPPGTNAQMRVRFAVTQASDVFFKGGAYRNADATQSAYADNVKVNGTLLYRRSFDQGRYNFPVGRLNAGQHTLEFALSSSSTSGSAKYWFGVNERSFDPLGAKSAWDPVQFLYYGAMRTGDYDAWSEGVAFDQGTTVNDGTGEGSRPPPVRRGTTFSIAVDHPALRTGNASLTITSPTYFSEMPWAKSLSGTSDYAGAIFVSGAASTRNREHWRVTVPSTAPVGRYTLRVFTPGGTQIGSDVAFYVIHNPYPLVSSGAVSKAELETYCYDEDEDGVGVHVPHGTDRDNLRDHFTAHYDGRRDLGYFPTTLLTGSFRRTNSEIDPSMLDIAAASIDGTTTEFESMLRLYRIVSQRIKYNRPDLHDDSADVMIGEFSPFESTLAFWYSLPGMELTELQTTGQCYEYGHVLTALARSAGILARPISSASWLGGWGNHVFAEAYVPNLPQHGGKRTSSNSSSRSDTDPWYTFDATDPNFVGLEPRMFTKYSEAVAPRAQFGRAAMVLEGVAPAEIDAVTNPLTWDPLSTAEVGTSGLTDVSSAYASGPEFWLTASGVTGWLGYGEKDVYRVSKSVTGARAVRVTPVSDPGGSWNLDIKLCIGSVSNSPVMPDRCWDAASTYTLPPGESYVVVFNDGEDMPARYLRGDVAKYVLDLVY